MSYQVDLSAEAEKVLDRVGRDTEKRLRKRLHELAADPFDPRISKLLTQAGGKRSARVGDWRIVYAVNRELKRVQVVTIRPRGQVYRQL